MSRSQKLKRPSSKKNKKSKKSSGKDHPWEHYKRKETGGSRIVLFTAIMAFTTPFWSVGAWTGSQLANIYSMQLMEVAMAYVKTVAATHI